MHSLLYHEKKRHGTVDFPVEYHLVESSNQQYDMPFHWHKEWELIRIIEGSFSIFADDEMINAEKGDVILIRDNMLHGGVPDSCVYECLVFDLHGLFRTTELIKKHLRPIYRMEYLPFIFYKKKDYEAICQMAADIMGCCKTNIEDKTVNYNELKLLAQICGLFSHILDNNLYYENAEILPHKSHRVESLKSVFEFIEQDCTQHITLNSLAKIADMNPNYFCRLFKEITMQTPIEYVMHYRIEKAAMMLNSYNMSNIEIALECGFNDYSYFIRTFKKIKGITPKQYQLTYLKRIKK